MSSNINYSKFQQIFNKYVRRTDLYTDDDLNDLYTEFKISNKDFKVSATEFIINSFDKCTPSKHIAWLKRNE